MDTMQQILVLEDLGIPKTDFESLAKKANLPFDIAWGKEDVKAAENVVGIVTIKAARKIDKEWLDQYPNIQFVAVAFTGYDRVNIEDCRQKNIAVFNVPTYSTDAVAELTIGLAISLFREIPSANHLVHSGKWDLTKPGGELSGKTIGILGTGTIGTRVASLFKAFNCNIVGWSRTEREEFKTLGNYISDLIEFFSSADIISVHLPLNEETTGIVGEEELSAMQETAYLINTARGPIVDENALIEALKNDKIAGVGIDVFDQEPLDSNNQLLGLQNAILTPHIAYKTAEALKRRSEVTINNIFDFTQNKNTNRVD